MIRKAIFPLILFSLSLIFPQDILEREFDIEPGKRLDVDLETGGSITITGWDETRIKVKVYSDGEDCEDIDIDISERPSGLSISTQQKGRWSGYDCDFDLDIHVPSLFDLEVETMGGGICIENVEGEIEGETKGGELNLTRIKGNLAMRTMGGNIILENSDVDGRIKTMGGNIRIQDVTGDVKGSSMGGNITYKDVTQRGNKTVNISTMGGNLDIKSKGGKVKAKTWGGNIDATGDEIDVSTMGGNITVKEAPLGADVHTMGGNIHIHSANKYVKAKTMGGDIDIDAVDGWVETSTMGGDVTVTMIGNPVEGKRNVEISSKGGDISLTVPPGLSMDFDIELAYTRNSRKNYKIDSDFDMRIEETDEWSRPRFMGSPRKYIYGSGSIAGGNNTIKIKTINGNIYIKRGK